MTVLDSQQVEILGRNLLVTHLLAGGVEVARPERDHGIDLIAYLDREPGEFLARPIQLKAGRKQAFSISRKYEKTPGLLIAFVWYVEDPTEAEVYALTHDEAVAVAEAQGYTLTSSWTDKGLYVSTKPSSKLQADLAPYRMQPEQWIDRIRPTGMG